MRQRRGGSFDKAVDLYERARPSYPEEAARWLVRNGARQVLDLAAGSGKFTRVLDRLGYEVTAVEPLDGMWAVLAERSPGVRVLAGRAEEIPLPDDSVDAVTVAQAWHWFDQRAAAAEVARVLRPGGSLGLVWNEQIETDWLMAMWRGVVDKTRTTAQHRASHDPEYGPAFTEPETTVFGNDQRDWTLATLLDNMASQSFFIVQEPAERDRLLAQAAEAFRTHPQTQGREPFTMPYRTRCWRASLR